VPEPFPSPTIPASSRTEVFGRHLDYFRARLSEKIEAMPPAELRCTRLAALRDRAARSRAIITAHDLDDVGKPGERWDGAEPATLERVLFHLLQEYARHLGVVIELATGLSEE
jgi:hypothetical protein